MEEPVDRGGVADGAGHQEMELDLRAAEEEQESRHWSSVSVGDGDTDDDDDSDCFFEPKQLSQNLDSEILLIQNALDIFDSSAETAYSDRLARDSGAGASSKPRAPVTPGRPHPGGALDPPEGGVSIRFLAEKQPPAKNDAAAFNPDGRFFLLNDGGGEVQKTATAGGGGGGEPAPEGEVVHLPVLRQELRPRQPPGDSPADPHGGEAVHVRHVRQVLLPEEQPAHAHADAQRGAFPERWFDPVGVGGVSEGPQVPAWGWTI
ncbi:uncharacterized protein LOC119206801 [Pungitius pungitius]|uniref:uncharacterized protein LOC119206801 n=1 Tax=Pungitius pungitius TaxID=134920 RepID=UPI002E0E8847